ncbi:NADH:flavin oxidoreductase [Salinisphaera sp.]|uniref:NADH:flavin oxidoreductase n=1 Tax=Salinisphaera sp. TaxID=1914330 RepID=UPI002D79C36C|nr:NADH:flavin oxidoreductase [Salinisphaera sp.]HET7314218.1 NADH:flavin oxidoreductase [Salinisphaera sp.]
MAAYSSLFTSLHLDSLALANRVVVSPMTRVSATTDGRATAQMAAYYARYARGGFGLVITEGTYTDEAYSQGYVDQPGIANDAQAGAWAKVVEQVHAAGAPIVLQLMHAGALVQHNRFTTKTIAPSAVTPPGEQMPMYFGEGGYATAQAMSETDIIEATQGFVAAAQRARSVGFDGVEVHGANGYLLDEFLTDYMNKRDDDYGGGIGNRVRVPRMIVRSLRDALGNDFPVGIRLSQTKVNDPDYRWAGPEDAEIIFHALAEAGASYLHVTGAGAVEPAFADDGPSLTTLAKRHGAGLPVISNGALYQPEAAAAMLDEQGADLVSIGRGALANSDWPHKVRAGERPRDFDPASISPVATLDNQAAWETDNADVFEPLAGG